MRAVVVHGAGDLRVEDRPDPRAEPGEVVIAVEWGGICGSDLAYWKNGSSGTAVLKGPLVLGHEIAGRIDEVGAGVSGVEIGQPVTVHPATLVGDGRLPARLAGRTNLYPQVRYFGSAAFDPHTDGGFVQRKAVRADQLRVLPDGVDTRSGALAEPLAVALHAVRRAGDLTGREVLVNGAGPIGALVVAAAKHAGAAMVIAADVSPTALAVAAAMGADTTVDVRESGLPEDIELIFEASGSPWAIGGVLHAVARRHGRPGRQPARRSRAGRAGRPGHPGDQLDRLVPVRRRDLRRPDRPGERFGRDPLDDPLLRHRRRRDRAPGRGRPGFRQQQGDAASGLRHPAREDRSMKITDARVVVSSPGRNYVTLVIETEDGVIGVGDATLNGRELAVASYLRDHVCPLLIGRDARRITDTWSYLYKGAYWRRGPITMTAIAAVDVALWDIKGKVAGLPVYELLGGAARDGVMVYCHASGATLDGLSGDFQRPSRPGLPGDPGAGGDPRAGEDVRDRAGRGQGRRSVYEPASGDVPQEDIWETTAYLDFAPQVMAHLRREFGYPRPPAARRSPSADPDRGRSAGAALEPYRMFWMEDPTPAEDQSAFRLIRQHTTTPLAVGEVFNSIWDCQQLITERLIDFIRTSVSHTGGITHLQRVFALADLYGVRSGSHGPGDVSPIAHGRRRCTST